MERQISFIPKYSFSYDIFLSFRGEDTRYGFTGHLSKAFKNGGINIFFDDKDLRVGDDISPTLLSAIEESGMSIIVFSENYASSTWCLDELVKIVECKEENNQRVWPIFYKVDPSDVRHQPAEGLYGKAMAKHETRYGKGSERVLKWKSALTKVANLSGDHLIITRHEYESEFVDKIVTKASLILPSRGLLVEKHIVGVESCIEEVMQILDPPSNSAVCMLGIYGTGGIGKTTLAKILYNSFVSQFDYATFLSDVRNKSLTSLQKRLLSQILVLDHFKNFDNVDEGAFEIKNRLCNRRVLMVLDDLDDIEQLQKLAGECDWFGPGSRIIVTTRDKHILLAHRVEKNYEMKNLNDHEASKLFCWKAFNSSQPPKEFVDLSNEVVKYASGLPLALKVIGSNLCGKALDECKCALDQYKKIPDKKIQNILRISYDGLEENQRNIFLDIACFFKGYSLEDVKNVMDACDFGPKYHIGVLIDKSLITVESGLIQIHDLIQDMGKEVVREVASKKLGCYSRLCLNEEVVKVLEGNLGTNKIEGIMLVLPQQKIQWKGIAFKRMKNLRILIVQDACFSIGPKYLPNSLRVLEWNRYPSRSLPPNFNPEKLVILKVPYSCFKLEKSFENFKYLSVVNFSHCQSIIEVPDMSGAQALREISLYDCENLVKVHDSVGFLTKVTSLDLQFCKNLTRLPTVMQMASLEELYMSCCTCLEHIPDFLGNMNCLSKLDADDTAIKELPNSIGNLTSLSFLNVSGSNLVSLPESIKKLSNLSHLDMTRCKNLQKIDELPFNLCRIEANGCTSLTSHSSGVLWSQAMKEISAIKIEMPGAQIPDWFDHRCKGSVLSFWARRKLPNGVLAFINGDGILNPHLFINGINLNYCFENSWSNLEKQECMVYLRDLNWDDRPEKYLEQEWNYVEIKGIPSRDFPDECGIYVYNKGTSMEAVRFECPYLTQSVELVLRNVLKRGAAFHPENEPPKKLRRKRKSKDYQGKFHNPSTKKRRTYLTKKGDQILMQNLHDHIDFPWERLWKLHLPLKVIIFLWELCNFILPTSDILNSTHVQVPQTCSLCQMENETFQHIFFQCTFVRALWFGSELSFWPDNKEPPNVIQLIMFFLQMEQFDAEVHKQITYPMALMLYTIWLFRNKAIFIGETPSSEVALKVWLKFCQRYIVACPAIEQVNSNFGTSKAHTSKQIHVLDDEVVLVYLSVHKFKKLTSKITYCKAFIINNSTGEMTEGNFLMLGATTKLQVLFQGLKSLLEEVFLCWLHFTSNIYMPSSSCIAMLNDPSMAPPHLQTIIKDINYLVSSPFPRKLMCGSFPHSFSVRVKLGSMRRTGKWYFFPSLNYA